jgi:riboflavin kinase / FMN adenylyltransferase
VQRWRGLESTPPGWGRCVVTIGMFDGVHRGHQKTIGRAVEKARDAGLPSVVLTFDPHPSEVVRPGSHPPMLTSSRYKAELLEALDVDVMCVLPFTVDFSRLSPDEFVHVVLVEHLHAAAVVVGENFRYGHKAAGDVAALAEAGRRFGFTVEGAPLQGSEETTWSSTYVRSCVDAGDVRAAAAALGREHRVEGVVVRGDRRGREIGYPTANVEPLPWSAVPADGVYAGRVVRLPSARRAAAGAVAAQVLPAAISVGTNPTFAGRERRVEAFVLDAPPDLDLYGEHVGVSFARRLRSMERYERVEDLVAQMDRDVALTREVLAGHPIG